MEVFFPWKGKRREYVWEEGEWKSVPFGFHASQVINTILDEDIPRLEELTGQRGEEKAIEVAWPVLALGIAIKVGLTFESIEEIPLGKKRYSSQEKASLSMIPLLNGQDNALWKNWPIPWPFFRKGQRFGWYLESATILQVANFEMVLAFQGKLKPFRVCKQCRRVYQGKGCPKCEEIKQKKGTFLTLLRQHKNRAGERKRRLQKSLDRLNGREEKARELQQAIEEIQYGIEEIGRIQEILRSGPLTKEIIKEYAEICKEAGLPTRWVKKY